MQGQERDTQGGTAPSDQTGEFDWSGYPEMSVGDILRKAREYYGLSLADVEASLRIRTAYLEALENGRTELLPGRVYAIGFVRSYAEFLQLDGDKMIHLFKGQSLGHAPQPRLQFPVAASESKLPSAIVFLSSFAGLSLLLGSIFLLADRPRPEPVPEVGTKLGAPALTLPAGRPADPDSMRRRQDKLFLEGGIVSPRGDANALFSGVAPADAVSSDSASAGAVSSGAGIDPAAQLSDNAGAGASSPGGRAVSIHFTERSWVQITNARKEVLVSRVMPAGAVFEVPQEKGIVMHAGNLGGMEIHVGSDVLPRLGRTGQIGRNIRLDADILKPIENGGEKVHVDSAVPAPPASGAAPRGGNR